MMPYDISRKRENYDREGKSGHYDKTMQKQCDK
jgi:hypothetical protein